MDKTQFVQISPGDLLPEDDLPGGPPPVFKLGTRPAVSRHSLILAMVLGLLAGAFLILVMVGLSHARH